jgi:hypothetical protein
MGTAFENLKTRQSLVAPETIKKVSAFDTLKQRQNLIGETTNKIETPKAKGGFVGEMLTGSTQKFGKTIGESLAAGKNTELYSQSLEQNTKIANDLRKRIVDNKKIGKDTSRLESALAQLIKDTPKQEQFTGNVINKTTGQILGEAGGTALETLSGGLLSSGAKTAISPTLSLLGKVKQGAKIGATYGAIGGGTSAMQEGEDVGGTLKSAGIGVLIGGALGGGLTYGGTKLGEKLANRPAKLATQKIEQGKKVTGEILQGTPDDIMRGQKILQNPKLKGAKTYQEGVDILDKEVTNLAKKQDTLLSKDITQRKLKDVIVSTKVGDETVKNNYVKDAIKQLKNYFVSTNDVPNLRKIEQLEEKARTKGITVKEINNIARIHGERLNAFNASGELSSGLNKQAAENTRSGLKTTVRNLFGGEKSKSIDKQIEDTIRVRKLFTDMSEKVNTLQQRIQERSLGAKTGYLVGKVINTIGLGSPKGIVEALIPRGQGFKVMNALDLEKNLVKNLKILQDVADKSIPESTLIPKLESFLKTMTKNYSLTQSPAQSITKTEISQNISKTLPKLKGKVKPSLKLKK